MRDCMRIMDRKKKMEMTLPGVETYAPRDGERLGRGNDWMFKLMLCRNLAANRHQYHMVRECASCEFIRGREYVYLLEHINGYLSHPITLEQVMPREIRTMNRIRAVRFLKTHCFPLSGYELRAGLYKYFFETPEKPQDELVHGIFGSKTRPHLRIGRATIWPKKTDKFEVLEWLNASLVWPLQKCDPILDDWKGRSKESFFPPTCSTVCYPLPIIERFFGFDRTPPDKYDAICPLDGYITTISAEYCSPGWTWSAKFGRHYKMRICPRCLRVMREKLCALS